MSDSRSRRLISLAEFIGTWGALAAGFGAGLGAGAGAGVAGFGAVAAGRGALAAAGFAAWG